MGRSMAPHGMRDLRAGGASGPALVPTPVSCAGFTLIEILVVIGIIATLLVLVVPSFSSLQSSSLSTGGNNVANLALAAHQEAVSRNVMTCLFLITHFPAAPDAEYRAFTVFEQDTDGVWTQAAKWTVLPKTIQVSSNAAESTFLRYTGTRSYTFPAFSFQGHAVDVAANCAYQVFLPSGQVDGDGTPVTLRVVASAARAGNANYYDLFINPMTGTIKAVRP